MANTDVVVVHKRRRWPRVLGYIVLCFILLLIAAYFVVSSSAFFKGVILPQAGKSLNANITVADASIHPFSGVVLHDVKVQTTGTEPLLTASEVRLAYSLGDIIGGNYHVKEMVATSPVVKIINNPDGTSNLDPLTKGKTENKPSNEPAKNAQPSKSSKPMRVDLNHIALNNATVVMIKNYAGGARDVTQVSNVNITLDNLANGQSGKLALNANVAINNHPPAPGTNAALQASAVGNFNFTMSQDLKPMNAKGDAHLDIQDAGGSMSEFSGLSAVVNCDVSPTEIKQVALNFQKNSNALGGIHLSGPFDMAKTEGKLNLDVSGIDRQVLNLLGASSGIDFGSTTLGSSNELAFSNGGATVTISGQFNANKMALKRQNETTPALEVHTDYQVTVNRQQQSALLQAFNLNGTQNQQPLLHGELAKPMTIAWGNGGNANVGDSSLKFTVTNLNLADWKAVLGNAASGGTANLGVDVLSQQAGKQLTVDFNSHLANVTAKVGTNELQQASLNLQGHIVDNTPAKQITGNVALTDLNGKYENYQFQNFGTKMDLDVVANTPQMEIKNIAGNFTQGQDEGGKFQLTGNYDSDKKSGQLALKLIDVNQNAVRPFLSSMLGDKKLVSISINSTTTANYASQGPAAIKTDLQVTNLVVSDPKNQKPGAPLAANVQLDASLKDQIAQVRQCSVTLSPTQKAAKNQLDFTGHVDMSQTNAIQGALKLTSDTFDVSPYYEIYSTKAEAAKANKNAPKTATTPAPKTEQASANANTEPPAKNLPFKNLTFDANIKHLYVEETEIANLQTAIKIDGSRVQLNPCQFSLNGGPVNATIDLNLGVPGYEYNIIFTGTNIPVQPLADTFSPEYSGRAKGDLFANLQIKGAGTTGASMQKNLSGNVTLLFTNANIQIVGSKIKKILTPIAMALRVPELLNSPLTWVNVNANIGSGAINLTQFKAAGDAFSASSQGKVTIADVLTNSPINNLPVNFALSGPLASKAGVAPANANTSSNSFVDLGKIATVEGTIGDPKTKIDYTTIGVITSRAVLNNKAVGGLIGGSTSNILKNAGGLGNLLNGNNQSATNQPNQSTNQPPAQNRSNPFDLLKKVIPK